MLPDVVIAAFLALSLALSFGRSLYESKKTKSLAKEDEPAGNEPFLLVGAIFALAFYIEMTAYPILVFLGYQNLLLKSFLQLNFPFDSYVQLFGIGLMVFGYLVVFWSLRILEYEKLTIRGPYRYMRHPQYLGYFIVFFGFFLTLLNLIALLPLLVIPGQVRMAAIEEEFLRRKYGDSYAKYERDTGRFLPKRPRG